MQSERGREAALDLEHVLETSRAGTSDGGEARYAWSFVEWYKRRCVALERIIGLCFQLGMLSSLACVTTYMLAHLTRGDEEIELVSNPAFCAFGTVLGVLALASQLIGCLGATWVERCMAESSVDKK